MITQLNGPVQLEMWCPGCEMLHAIDVTKWRWDGDRDEPTVTPSILVEGGGDSIRCHSYLVGGQWAFLPDCTHPLAGQTVPMVPIPAEWMAR